jgi:AcrR family transcriptional regulator
MSLGNDDVEVTQLLQATRRAVNERGGQITLADVAQKLGVSAEELPWRSDSTDDLLIAAAGEAMTDFVGHLVAIVRGMKSTVDVVVEGLAAAIENLPDDPYVGILLRDRPDTVARAITSVPAQVYLQSAWHELMPDSGDHSGFLTSPQFGEMMLRTVQSFVLDPGPTRSSADLRRFLRAWFGPVIDAHVTSGAPSSAGAISRSEVIAWQLGILRDALDEDE